MEANEEEVTLERLTYLIVEKVGPSILISYNVLRDRVRAKFDPDSKLLDAARDKGDS